MKCKYILCEHYSGMTFEVIFKYPRFKSLKDGLRYINNVLDPYYTGKYGIITR